MTEVCSALLDSFSTEDAAEVVITTIHRRHRHREFLKTVDASTPQDLDLCLIADNDLIHKTPAVQ